MSVYKNNRNKSSVDFVDIAREINIYTIKACVSFPKRYTFFLTQHISESANRIYEYVVCANKANPRNQHEAQIRRDFLTLAYAQCEHLIAKIGIARDMFGISDKTMTDWMALIDKEEALITGVKKSDAEKYKSLPESAGAFPVSALA